MARVAEVFLYVAVPKRWWFDTENREAGGEQIIDELCAMSGELDFSRYDGTRDGIDLVWLEDPQDDPVAAAYWNRERRLLPSGFLRLRSSISVSDEQLEPWMQDIQGISEEEALRMYLDSVAGDQHHRWRDIVVASHLSLPGALTYSNSFTFFEGSPILERGGAISIFLGPRKTAEALGWPTIHSIRFRDVWAWLNGLKGFESSLAEGKTGRAVGALTYLIHHRAQDENVLSLVWGLLGLEALYGEGNVGMRGQLLQKSEAFLGKRLGHTKQFGWMYDYRSRFLHGDLDFTFNHHDGRASGDQFYDELGKATNLAGAMLIATVQEMCVRNIYEIGFEYVLRKP